jgi:methionine-rich copper-binding protein CopC
MKNALLAGMIVVWATAALAHSPLEATTPTDRAIITEVPSEVLLEFKDDMRLTRMTMTHADHAGVDLDISGHDGFISDYAIPMQSMGSGDYVIEWRGLGDDGHAMTGTFSFSVE